MTKVRTIQELQDALDKDFAWRLHELTYLRRMLKPGKPELSRAGVRASTTILYAHWEGFIKSAAQLYLQYVARQGHKFHELSDCFSYIALRQEINDLSATKKASRGVEIMRLVRQAVNSDQKFSAVGTVDTESNLNSEVFLGILALVGFDDGPYSAFFNLIDATLLANRNKIAHGEYIEIDDSGYTNLEQTVLDLMRRFKSDVEFAVSNTTYKPKPAEVVVA